MDSFEVYTADYYSAMKRKLHKNSLFHRHRMNILRKLAAPRAGEEILDLGCGIGAVSIEFARLGARMTGLDNSEIALQVAQEIYQEIGQAEVRFVQAEADGLPFAARTFDKVICADLVEHIDRPTFLRMLSECERVLKPEGRLVIYTPCPTHLFEALKRNNLILKRDESHIDLKGIRYLQETLTLASFVIDDAYFENSHIPIWNILERLLMNSSIIGGPFRRRICIRAAKMEEYS